MIKGNGRTMAEYIEKDKLIVDFKCHACKTQNKYIVNIDKDGIVFNSFNASDLDRGAMVKNIKIQLIETLIEQLKELQLKEICDA